MVERILKSAKNTYQLGIWIMNDPVYKSDELIIIGNYQATACKWQLYLYLIEYFTPYLCN